MPPVAQNADVATPATDAREQMDVVVVGHVDHGKSTVIGRLMADTGSLPEGKLDQIRAQCARNARPFEYAFLLDALKNEQAQGITIDTARVFFKTAKRNYIIHDAPGHIEFLKNMVTGAARAEAALLVIDAEEGIQENSKRHGYILSMLGIREVAVLVNKMDLVDYDQSVFESLRDDYSAFLANLGVRPRGFIPVSAREGDNITAPSARMPWYDGPDVVGQVDAFDKASDDSDLPFRMPVQDIYKFTADGDDRRIVAGTIETGTVRPGDDVILLPSGKASTIKTIEVFQGKRPGAASASQATGFTLTTQVYIRPGELMVRADQPRPLTGTRFRANIFWMGHAPMLPGKRYKLKIGAAQAPVELAEVINVLDVSELSSIHGKRQLDRHDVSECVLETTRPVAFDLAGDIAKTARLVIVDNYEIAGCGMILEADDGETSLLAERMHEREVEWQKGSVTSQERADRYRHAGKFVVFVGSADEGTNELAQQLEQKLFKSQAHTYYLSLSNVFDDIGSPGGDAVLPREEQYRRLGELARIMTDAGIVFITALDGADEYDIRRLKLLCEPGELFVICVGMGSLGELRPDLRFPADPDPERAVGRIMKSLNGSGILPEYQI